MPNSYLRRIDLWSIRLKAIVIISTFSFIGIVGYFFSIGPILEKKQKIYLAFQASKKELNYQLEISAQYPVYQEKIKNIKNEFGIFAQQLNFWQVSRPRSNSSANNNHEVYEISSSIDKNSSARDLYSNDFTDILNALSGQLSAPGFKVNKIRIIAIKKAFLNSLQVESDFSDTDNNIINFLDKISRLNRFILINKFRWKLSNGLSKKQNIIFLFKTYVKPFNTKNLITALLKIYKLDAESVFEFSNQTKFPLRKIKMLGFLSAGKYPWGFVSLPNEQVCKLKLGDILGLERGIVIGIYAHEIFIQNNSLDKIIKMEMGEGEFSYVKNSV